jgi:hypothetical protein
VPLLLSTTKSWLCGIVLNLSGRGVPRQEHEHSTMRAVSGPTAPLNLQIRLSTHMSTNTGPRPATISWAAPTLWNLAIPSDTALVSKLADEDHTRVGNYAETSAEVELQMPVNCQQSETTEENMPGTAHKPDSAEPLGSQAAW